MEKSTPARHRPERQHNARSNRRKQCSPNGTKPYSNPTPPRKRQNTPTNGHTPRRMKPTHTRLTYTRMRPHVPSHQAGDQPVPAHTERRNPPKVRTQRQSGLPPASCQLTGPTAPLAINQKAKCLRQPGGGAGVGGSGWGGGVVRLWYNHGRESRGARTTCKISEESCPLQPAVAVMCECVRDGCASAFTTVPQRFPAEEISSMGILMVSHQAENNIVVGEQRGRP